MQIPFLDLKTPNSEAWDEVKDEIESAVRNAMFIGGPAVSAFEEDFAAYCSTAHCAALNSGTDAIRLALMALGIGPGDEVITVAHTFIATTEAVSQVGARPVFVDIHPETYCMDVARIEAAITPRTRAILPVHLYGQCADMDPILEIAARHNLVVVEDACQAQGATYKGRPAGSMGQIGAFSFYPGKNLGAWGEAGAVTSNDPELIARVKMIRDHGQSRKYYHDVEGYNARLDSIQCIALRAKLRKLPEQNAARNRCASYYAEMLSECPGITLPKGTPHTGHVYHLYVVLVEDRDGIAKELNDAGIGTGLHYPLPLHLQKAYEHLGLGRGSFPVTERVADTLLSLPMYPTLTGEQMDYVAKHLISAVDKRRK